MTFEDLVTGLLRWQFWAGLQEAIYALNQHPTYNVLSPTDRIHESRNQGLEMSVTPLKIIPSNQLAISFDKCTLSQDNIDNYKDNLLERTMDFLLLKTVLGEIIIEALEFHNRQLNLKKGNISLRFTSQCKEQETLTESC